MRLSKEPFEEMVEEATVDCYNDSEQTTGWFTIIESNLGLPFKTAILGVMVTVDKVDLTVADQIVARCRRGKEKQLVSILDLPLPSPSPAGAEWIEAYRRWFKNTCAG